MAGAAASVPISNTMQSLVAIEETSQRQPVDLTKMYEDPMLRANATAQVQIYTQCKECGKRAHLLVLNIIT